MSGRFHPVVEAWFDASFPEGPTEPQQQAWGPIAEGRDVLVAAPTGTGKTLTGFLVAINRLLADPRPARGPRVVYLSPLRALATDVHENLEAPLAAIGRLAAERGEALPELKVAVRTGDTPQAERQAMRRNPPDLLVTTPESLYLLLTSPHARQMLADVETVIVDEIHALARDKRGSHLALTLARLDAHCERAGTGRPQRIGLSATQRPLSAMAELLVGSRPPAATVVVDCGRRGEIDLELVLPAMPLEAVASTAQVDEMVEQVAELVMEHSTTLVFVNTRKLAERLAHQLAGRLSLEGRLGEDAELLVAAHHGSLSARRRREVEQRLKAGGLKALVATASLELGIDVGPVDLVVQVGTPRSIATMLQRVGRANHRRGGTPKGRVLPYTRDELVECAAMLGAIRRGDLDAVLVPVAPLDVLAQQLVAEVASREELGLDELFELVTAASPYASLSRERFDEVVELVATGIATGRGPRGAHLHLDAINAKLRPRRGALLAALLGGGAIPETGDYRVVLDPEGVTVGSVHEDFAVESSVGDIFLLGTHSWQVVKVETGVVRVRDAGDQKPTVPFWLGEAPARSLELSAEVAQLRQAVLEGLGVDGLEGARRAVAERCGVGPEAVKQIADYLAASAHALGTLPTQERIVIERCFDEVEGSQLIVHAPFGGRLNRALGLALRKRFCVTFDFELQAAANDDAVAISLGPHHSFRLDGVPAMLRSSQVRDVLTQAVLPHPLLQSRWRWNLNRALVVPRMTGKGARPIHLQRMEAEDLLAATWPSLAACQENAPPGPIPVPDHVLVAQTVNDTLSEPLDADGLAELWARLEAGEIAVHCVESAEPSPLAHEILNGQPYTFLDDAPLEERRSRAVGTPRGIVPIDRSGRPSVGLPGGQLDPEALRSVVASLGPRVGSADELHDLLLRALAIRPVARWMGLAGELRAQGRLLELDGAWVAAEAAQRWPAALEDDDEAAARHLEVHLACSGPTTLLELVSLGQLGDGPLRGSPLPRARAATALARLVGQGVAIELEDDRCCARNVLTRLQAATRSQRRRRVVTVPVAGLVDLLARHQHVADGTKLSGRAGVLAVVEQLQGVELPAADWEAHVLPARLQGYDPAWLDELCLAGEVAWLRLTPGGAGSRRGAAVPSASTPLALVLRADLPWLLAATRGAEVVERPEAGPAADLLEVLEAGGARFRTELPELSGRLAPEVDEGLWDLVARGLVTADSFSAVRSLLSPASRMASRYRAPSRLARRRASVGSGSGEGRWGLVAEVEDVDELELAGLVAEQLLVRWGVVAYELFAPEPWTVSWREVRAALRRAEARGLVLGGRFVAGISGEQYALASFAEQLGKVAPAPATLLCASDPLNLTGTIAGGARVRAARGGRIRLEAGRVVEATEAG